MSVPATALAFIVASQRSIYASAFAPSAPVAIVDNLTPRKFRHIDDGDFSFPTNFSSNLNNSNSFEEPSHETGEHREPGPQSYELPNENESYSISTHFSMSSAPLSYFSVNRQTPAQMPTWLRPSGDEAEKKLSHLRETMNNSYLSHLKAEQVISAIRVASSGDTNKIAGAADFCLVLVETMEMGVNTLIAAAFHYCECFEARQKSSLLTSEFSASDYWTHVAVDEQKERRIKFGDDADRIAKDAARLKRTEMLAGQSLKSRMNPTMKDAENMRKMLLSETKDWRALAIRSAGCLFRLRGIENERERSGNKVIAPKDIRVAHEALAIHAPLASRLGMHRLKNEIEGAAFRVLYPRQYAKLMSLTRQNTPCNNENGCLISTLDEGMGMILQRVKDELKDILKKDPCFLKYADSVTVSARIKEPYSLWRKMLKTNARHILEVPDSLALRVVLQSKKMTANENAEVTSARDRALCYYARQQCTKKFKPLEDNGRFKDYIANPKPNGYQSLHYTASTEFDGTQWPFEIQFRSNEMHQVAEFGLAAHWGYKEQNKSSENEDEGSAKQTPHYAFHLDQSTDAYLRSVQNWHWQQVHGKISWRSDSSSAKETGEDLEKTDRVRARDERLAPYLQALMADQSNLTREQVFIFLQSQAAGDAGVTMALPAGSCILDAIRESERAFGLTSSRYIKEVEHNGSLASITRKLSNGDILTI